MKRLDKHQSKEFGPVRLRPTDLREIFTVLEGRAGLELIADDIQFDSPDELFAEYNGRVPNTARIKTSSPYLTVELNQLWTRLFVASSDTVASGLFAQVDSVLRRCERKPRFLFNYWRLIVVFWLLQLLPALGNFSSYRTAITVTQMVLIIWFAWVFFVHLRRHSFIQTDTSASKSFWTRNSDSVVVAVISALLGAAGGVFASKVADHYFPAPSSNSAAPAPNTGSIGE